MHLFKDIDVLFINIFFYNFDAKNSLQDNKSFIQPEGSLTFYREWYQLCSYSGKITSAHALTPNKKTSAKF